MEAIIIVAWIAIIVALAYAGVVSAADSWSRIQPDHERVTPEGSA
ncbi:MAG: hypothetical protein ABWY52_01785 [Candidatus Limnocylindrales bacterium]